jgi:hypothetical protein
MKMAIFVLAFIFLRVGFAPQSEAASCHSVDFNAQLSAGETLEKPLGHGLIFYMSPDHLGPNGEWNGWSIKIATAEARNDDYIYPASPPLRFNPAQTFGANYGNDAKASLTYTHEVRFLLSRADYDRLWPLLTNAVWPYNAPQPDQAGNEYVKALNSLRTGELKATVLSYELEPGKDSIRRMRLRVRVTAPVEFAFSPELKAKPAHCAAERNF